MCFYFGDFLANRAILLVIPIYVLGYYSYLMMAAMSGSVVRVFSLMDVGFDEAF